MMGLPHQFILNRRGLENGVVLSETGLLQMREKKSQTGGPLWVALGCLMANAINMAVESHDYSVSETSQGHKPIRAGKHGATFLKTEKAPYGHPFVWMAEKEG